MISCMNKALQGGEGDEKSQDMDSIGGLVIKLFSCSVHLMILSQLSTVNCR